MLLRGPGARFRLRLLNRSNEGWCKCTINVDCERGAWSATFTGLPDYEIDRLAAWLDSAAGHSDFVGRLSFLEPELAFELREGQGRTLRVYFAYDSRPDRSGLSEPEQEVYVEFPVDQRSLDRAADELRADLAALK
jgi:hypothetical protein